MLLLRPGVFSGRHRRIGNYTCEVFIVSVRASCHTHTNTPTHTQKRAETTATGPVARGAGDNHDWDLLRAAKTKRLVAHGGVSLHVYTVLQTSKSPFTRQ